MRNAEVGMRNAECGMSRLRIEKDQRDCGARLWIADRLNFEFINRQNSLILDISVRLRRIRHFL